MVWGQGLGVRVQRSGFRVSDFGRVYSNVNVIISAMFLSLIPGQRGIAQKERRVV